MRPPEMRQLDTNSIKPASFLPLVSRIDAAYSGGAAKK